MNKENAVLFKENRRRCGKCKFIKELSNFTKVNLKYNRQGYYLYCKDCHHKITAEFRKNNPQIVKQWSSHWKQNDGKDYHKNYRKEHPDQNKNYHKTNREKITKRKVRHYHLFIDDKLRTILRTQTRRAIKDRRTEQILGCSFNFFKNYFETKFSPEMTWEMFMSSKIVIDHIIPLNYFNLQNVDQVRRANHYTNMCPLYKLDNFKKGKKMPDEATIEKVKDDYTKATGENWNW